MGFEEEEEGKKLSPISDEIFNAFECCINKNAFVKPDVIIVRVLILNKRYTKKNYMESEKEREREEGAAKTKYKQNVKKTKRISNEVH